LNQEGLFDPCIWSLGTEELLKQFKQQNVELQREIETLRARLEYTYTVVNDKLGQQKTEADTSSTSVIQTAFEQIRQTETKLQELKLKSASQQEENDLLKYLVRIEIIHTWEKFSFEKWLVRKNSTNITHRTDTINWYD